MNILSWNCQGMRSPLTVRHLKEIRKQLFLDIIFLIETKNNKPYVESIKGWMGYSNSHIVKLNGLSGGLALLRKCKDVVSIINNKTHVIDTKIQIGTTTTFVSFIYGHLVRQHRREVWEEIQEIKNHRHGPRILIGDFNEILDKSDKLGGQPRQESSFTLFRNLIRECDMLEIINTSPRISWMGKRNNIWTKIRLDRAFGNTELLNIFWNTNTQYLLLLGFDHIAVYTTFCKDYNVYGRWFYCDKRWIHRRNFIEVIKKQWTDKVGDQNPLTTNKIIQVRNAISRWKKSNHNNSATQMNRLQQSLDEEINRQYPDESNISSIRRQLEYQYSKEEKFWK